MRGWAALVVFVLALLLTAASFSWATQEIINPKARTLSTKGLWQLGVRTSDVVVLGRVLAPMASPDTLYHSIPFGGKLVDLPATQYLALTIRIEPIEYLKGGLDGDLLDTRYRFGGSGQFSGNNPNLLASLAGQDTLGAIFFLEHEKTDWWLASIRPALPANGVRSESPELEQGLREGFVRLPQRKWSSTLEQVRAWIREMPPDSSVKKP